MRIKKMMSLGLCCFLTCSLFVGCRDKSSSTNKSNSANTDTNVIDDARGKGVHDRKIVNRTDYFVNNGKSDYKIVLPSSYKDYEMKGALLIQEYIEKSAGVKLPIVSDDSVGVSAKGKFLSVGDTKLMRGSGISIAYDEFGNSGFKIVTKGNIVYISGARSALAQGTYYGAQEFLKETVNFRVYANDEIKYDRASSLKMKEYNVTEIPEFDYRRISFKSAYENSSYATMLRLSPTSEGRLPYSGHSHFEVLPPSLYYAEHPEWYWNPANLSVEDAKFNTRCQLCMTNEELRTEFVNQLVNEFQKYPDRNFVHLGVQDTVAVCECTGCQAAMKEYGTNASGLSIIFTNDVARRVQAIIWESQPDRMLTFETFAYLGVEIAPVHEENGVIVPDCEEVIPDDNVMIQYAPLHANASEAMTHVSNSKDYANLKNWSVLTKNISTWCYGTNFDWLLITHKDWDVFTDNLLLYSGLGVQNYYSQNCFNGFLQPWETMKLYVESQLLWNVRLSYEDLVEEFIENYYGDAAPYVLEAYKAMSTYYEYTRTELGLSGSVYVTLSDEKYWTYAYVESMRQIWQKAFNALEPLKERDESLYQKYRTRVEGLYIENLFMQLQYHRDQYGAEYCLQSIEQFADICNKYGIIYTDETKNTSVAEYIMKWSGSYAQ